MKIRAIHTNNFGPLGTQSFNFQSEWSQETSERVLFSGPNGCGKSTLLRAISVLWSAFGHWLHTRKPLPKDSPERLWLERWGGIAVVLEDLPFDSPSPLVLYFGTSHEILKFAHAYNSYGECQGQSPELLIRIKATPLNYQDESLPWLDEWTRARQRMIVSPTPSKAPNMLFLDAEERRWVTPTRNLGEIKPENMSQRWLGRYQVSENWDGQVESALLSMKVAADERFQRLIKDMNAFLSGKVILNEVTLGENRLRVKLSDGTMHGIDDLSSGEHQVLIQLYMIDRWMEDGGIALIDEPDLYLHPSLVSGFLAQLETMVSDRNGQLLISSHMPEVWDRYESLGQRVTLGDTK